jgi:GNAT superfamily N-acetyltransferase
MDKNTGHLRLASEADRPAIEALISRSVTELMGSHYSPVQLEAARRHIFGVDGELLADGTYFVVEARGALVAAGGWSRRRSLFGGDAAVTGRTEGPLLNPACDAARIRAFFVHPSHARRGLGRQLLSACIDAARDAGFSALELVATLSGVGLYRAAGFTLGEPLELDLPGGVRFPVVRMLASLAELSRRQSLPC